MVLLVARAHEEIERVLSGRGEVSPNQIINDTGRWLVTAWKWKYLEGAEVYLDLVKNQDFVELPADFRDLITVERPKRANSSFSLTSISQLNRLRNTSLGPGPAGRYWGAVVHRQAGATATLTHDTDVPADDERIIVNSKTYRFKTTLGDTNGHVKIVAADGEATADNLIAAIMLTGTAGTDYADETTRHATVQAKRTSSTVVQFEAILGGEVGNAYTLSEDITDSGWVISGATFSGGGGPPTKRLDIWPTPSADDDDGLVIRYRSGWATVSEDTTFISVPEELELVFLEAVKAFARATEDDIEHPGILSEYIGVVRNSSYFMDAQDWDATTQRHYGALKGGYAAERIRTRWLDTFAVNNPS